MNLFAASSFLGSVGGGGIITPPSDLARFAGALFGCLGNSLILGDYPDPSVASVPVRLQAAFAALGIDIDIINAGIDGGTDGELDTAAESSIDPFYDSGRLCVLLYCEVGNTLYDAGDAVDSAIASAKAAISNRNAGWEKWWIGLQDRGVAASLDPRVTPGGQNRAAYRATLAAAEARIESEHADVADGFIRLLDNPKLTDCTDTTYFVGDETHNTALGRDAWVETIMAGL